MTDKNRDFPEAARVYAAELGAIFADLGSDVVRLEAQLGKLGFGKDSVGQWFHKGQVVPYPPAPAASGILPMN